MELDKKIYFASDLHLGAPTITDPVAHERRFVRWLDSIKDSAAEIYLLGDIFDFWFEYKRVIPKGFSRFIGKLCELTDAGIPVYFFTGNHDIWVFDYLPGETGVTVYHQPVYKNLKGKRFFLAHGDDLAPFEKTKSRLKTVFKNRTAQKIFRHLHPDIGVWIAAKWSRNSRDRNVNSSWSVYRGEEKEWLVSWARQATAKEHVDFFVFGHRHLSMEILLTANSKVIYLGDWIDKCSYGVWDGSDFTINYFQE